MAAAKHDRKNWHGSTTESLAAVTVTIEGNEDLTVRPARKARPLVTKIMESAVESNQRLGGTGALTAPVLFEIDGHERLVALAAHFGTELEASTKFRSWNPFFDHLASLTLCLSEGVFAQNGAQTSSEVALRILGDMGFQSRSAVAREELIAGLLDCMKSDDTQRVAAFLRDSFDPR